MIAIVQARLNSNRLPNKVLMEINKKTILELVYKRLKKSKYIKKIIFAIPNDKKNKFLEKKIKKLKFIYYKGSNLNVLKRYFEAAKKFKANNIVRVTCDCPLVDSKIIDSMISFYRKNNVDYLSNNNPPSYPHGMDAEIFNFSTLKLAYLNAYSKRDKEHVTYYITRNKKKFKIKNFKNSKNLSKIRITLDYLKDYIVIKEIFNYFYPNIYFGLNKITKLYNYKPKLFS